MSTAGLVRYDVRPNATGWTVIDLRTGRPASVDGVAIDHLGEDEAGEIADLLNTLEVLRGSPVYH